LMPAWAGFGHAMLLMGSVNMGSAIIVAQSDRIIESFMVELVHFREVLVLPSFGQNEHMF
jgi:hypothetical protein